MDGKKVIEKGKLIIKNILTDNISELNDLIYEGTKLCSDKIGISQRSQSERQKRKWEMRLKRQKRDFETSERTKKRKIHLDTIEWKDRKTIDNTTEKLIKKNVGERKET